MANIIGGKKIKGNVIGNTKPIKANVAQNKNTIKANITNYPYATTEHKGVIRIATDEEALAGIDKTIAITPFTLNDFVEKNALSISTLYAKNVDASIDSYALTIVLKDQNGDILSSKTVDLPIEDIETIKETISSYGNIVTHNTNEFATNEQGLLAETALQPNDNITELNNNAGFITNAVADLTNYYLKSETYTKQEVNQLIASIPKFTVTVVQELPLIGEGMVLYLVPKDSEAPDVYDEYIWITETESYELIGATAVDLDGYATEEFVNNGLATKQNLLTSDNAGNCIEITIGSSSGLPAEYQEVEYLDSTGTQYIDTGITPTGNTDLDLYGVDLPHTSGTMRFGSRIGVNNNSFNFVATSTNKLRFDYGSAQEAFEYSDSYDRLTFNHTTGKASIYKNNSLLEGITLSQQTFNSPYNLYLFALNSGGQISPASGYKIRYCKIWENNILVRNFIPARRKSDSVLGMYDTVSGDFLTNAGTGDFIAGQDVEETTKISFVNDAGYTTNKGTVTSINNTLPDNNGNVEITIPDTATWGNITGTLSDQTDLQSALDSKVNTSDFIAYTAAEVETLWRSI